MSHFHVRRSTGVLLLIIAGLVGALVANYSITHTTPAFLSTAQAAPNSGASPFYTFAPVVSRAMPAVVNVASSKVVKQNPNNMPGMFDDPIFRQFFGGRMPQQPQRPRSEREQSLGSGVVVSADGYIITNNHVVDGATDIKVSFANKREFPAKVVGTDPMVDIAVLKIDQTGLPALPLSDSSHAQVGDVVLAIGNPFGLHQTVTMGIVSATGRSGFGIERLENFIQTDAPINPGNSGGALINTRGELVAINTAILAGNSGGNQGIGFAIPANIARQEMDQIIKTGKVVHGYMGILPQELTPQLAQGFGNANLKGVAVSEVEPNSPAQKAGLQVGDVITAVNGQPVTEVGEFRIQIAGLAPGSVANLKVVRNGQEMNIPVTLGTLKNETANGEENQGAVPGTNGERGALNGVSVQTITPDLANQMQMPDNTKGVVVTDLDASSAAASAGVQQGDVIAQVNHKPVNNVQQFNAAVRAGNGGNSTLLLVKRAVGNQWASLFIVVPNSK